MKQGVSHLHRSHTAAHPDAHHQRHGKESLWLPHHILAVLVLTCILTYLLILVMSLIQIYYSSGIWPLFG
jgi:hypothetical protein